LLYNIGKDGDWFYSSVGLAGGKEIRGVVDISRLELLKYPSLILKSFQMYSLCRIKVLVAKRSVRKALVCPNLSH